MSFIYVSDRLFVGYAGGQLEIQDSNNQTLLRGEISETHVIKNALEVTFAWLARAKSVWVAPNNQVIPSGEWVVHDTNKIDIDLVDQNISNIGGNRIAITSKDTSYLAVFNPPNGSKLDPTRVEGLVLP